MEQHFLYTNDGINYETKPDAELKFKLKLNKVDKNTNKYVCFNYDEDNNEDKCLSYWFNLGNEWVDHPPDRLRYKKHPYGTLIDYHIDNQPFRIEYYSIHCMSPFDLVLFDERFRIDNQEIVASNYY